MTIEGIRPPYLSHHMVTSKAVDLPCKLHIDHSHCRKNMIFKPTIHISTFTLQQFVCRQIFGNNPSTDRRPTDFSDVLKHFCQLSVENIHFMTTFELASEKVVVDTLAQYVCLVSRFRYISRKDKPLHYRIHYM